jgi:hypothetical protein
MPLKTLLSDDFVSGLRESIQPYNNKDKEQQQTKANQ